MVGAGSLLLQRGTPGQLALVSELRDRAAGSGVERAAARGLIVPKIWEIPASLPKATTIKRWPAAGSGKSGVIDRNLLAF